MISKLFLELYKGKTFTTENFIKGLDLVAEALPDVSIDIPNAPAFVGRFFGQLVADEIIPFSFLEKLLHPLQTESNNIIVSIGTEVFRTIVEMSESMFRGMIEKSSININTLFKPDTFEDLINGLEDETLFALLPLTIGKMIHDGSTADQILDWIESTGIPSDVLSDIVVCQQAIKATLEHVIPNPTTSTIKQELLQEYAPLFIKISSSNEVIEMSCINQAQEFCKEAKFPQDLLVRLFSYLFENNIVKIETFQSWSKESDSSPGKQQALSQANKWLQSLHGDQKL